VHPYFDLNDDEREEYRHQELMLQASPRNPYTMGTAHIYRRAHDRIYGIACRYCLGPSLDRLDEAYKREALEPTTTLEAKRAEKSKTGHTRSQGLQDLLDEIMRPYHDPDKRL